MGYSCSIWLNCNQKILNILRFVDISPHYVVYFNVEVYLHHIYLKTHRITKREQEVILYENRTNQ